MVVLGVTVITFILQHLIASGAKLARAILGPRATALSIHAYITEYGLNRSLVAQYWAFLWQLLHGNLGYSYKLNQPVNAILGRDIPNDLVLVGVGLALGIVMAVPLGIMQAVHRGKAIDHLATSVSFLLYAMPTFWLGIVLIEIFAVNNPILPAEAPQGSITQILQHPEGLVLPIATLTLANFALYSRYMRGAAIQTLADDYIRTAYAKGLPQHQVLMRHLLRNSAAAIATLIGLSFPAIFTWGLVVEYVFNFPGTGLAFYNAAVTADYPLELGITVVVGVATVLGSLVADLTYAVLDPRIRYE